jgi:ABC-2 type transport system permease protein
LKPVHPIHSDIADNASFKLITMPAMLVVAACLVVLFRPALHLVPWAVVLFIPAFVLAFLLRFFLEWTLAQVAFWTTRVSAVNQMYFTMMLFLSGQIAPLGLFPAPIRTIATILPFRWMVGFPVELFLGRLTFAEALTGLAVQSGWLVVSLVLVRIVWRAGVRVYSAVGA